MRCGSRWLIVAFTLALASLAGCVILPFPYDDFMPAAASGSISVIASGADEERHRIGFQSGGAQVLIQVFQRDEHAWVGVDVFMDPGTRASFAGPTLSLSTAQGVVLASLPQLPLAPPAPVQGSLDGLPSAPGRNGGGGTPVHAAIRTSAPLVDEYELQLPDLHVQGEPVLHFPPIRFRKSSHVGWAVPM